MYYLIINSRFGSKLLAARLPRFPPACGGLYVVARPRLGFGAPRLTPRRPRQPCWRRRRRPRHRRSLLRAPAWCVRLEVSPPASALSPARSAPLAALSSLRSLPPICIKSLLPIRQVTGWQPQSQGPPTTHSAACLAARPRPGPGARGLLRVARAQVDVVSDVVVRAGRFASDVSRGRLHNFKVNVNT